MHAPFYLQDYECDINFVTSPHSLANVLSYDHYLSSGHKSFVKNVGQIEEPKYYHRVARLHEWQQAMYQELQALE